MWLNCDKAGREFVQQGGAKQIAALRLFSNSAAACAE
jgi:hypothetical protein